MTMRATPSAAALLLLLALTACNRKATREECNQMLERYVDMTIEPNEGAQLTAAQVAAIRDMKKAIRKAEPHYGKVMMRCERELSRRQYDCAMKAGNANEWEACVQD